MRILLDCDEVLADFVGAALDITHKLGFRRPDRSEVTQFRMSQCEWFQHNTTQDPTFPHRLWRELAQPGIAANLRKMPECDPLADLLTTIGAEVTVLTAPLEDSITWRHERVEWLTNNFSCPHAIVLDSRKWNYNGDLFVDDNEDNCRLWQAAHPRGHALLWRTSHSRPHPGHPFIGSALELAMYIATRGELEVNGLALDWAMLMWPIPNRNEE